MSDIARVDGLVSCTMDLKSFVHGSQRPGSSITVDNRAAPSMDIDNHCMIGCKRRRAGFSSLDLGWAMQRQFLTFLAAVGVLLLSACSDDAVGQSEDEVPSSTGENSAARSSAGSTQAAGSGTEGGLSQQRKLPKDVAAKLHEMDNFCREAGGRSASNKHLMRADFNADGLDDYVIDENSFECPPELNPFTGTMGGMTFAYISDNRGQARLAYEGGTLGARIASGRRGSTATLFMSEGFCREFDSSSSGNCSRTLRWDAATRQLIMSDDAKDVAASHSPGRRSASHRLSQLMPGTWETTLVGTEPDPGRCVSRPGYYENSVAKFDQSGRWEYFHQEGDTVGSWRVSGEEILIKSDGSEGAWTVKILSNTHLLLSSPGSETERYRRCQWR